MDTLNINNGLDFMATNYARKRYWARSMFGWGDFSSKVPNIVHEGLAQLEKEGYIHVIITQVYYSFSLIPEC